MLPEITALRLQKKNQQRVNVHLDGKYAFGLQASVAASLKVGQRLSPEEVDQLQRRDAAEVAYDRALNYLSYRPRSRAEIEAYLKRRRVPPITIQTVMDRLVGAGLLDDEAFAQYWVENREHFRPRGIRSLRFELRQKGVPDTVIDKAITNIDETESAYRAGRERARRLRRLDYQEFRRRLGGFLQRRGFGYDVVKVIVDRLWRELQAAVEEEPF
jgi:regulatory protein